MSQLLSRLEFQLQSTSNPIKIAEIKARKSCYLARTGYFDEARGLIADLRKDFGSGENPRVSVLIMLAEGIAENFQYIGPMARDRIARSQLISRAIGDRELLALASAWKAHLDFEVSDFKAMGTSLRAAIEMADSDNHEANSRIAMVLSNCMYLFGDRDAAQRWFMTGRDHALAEGDQAAIDALLYNRAAFGISNLRTESCVGEVDSKHLDLLHLEIGSAENFTTMARIISFNHLVRLCKARILVLKEQYHQALEIFAVVRTEKPFATYNFSKGMIDLERAYCLHKCGQQIDSKQLFESLDPNDGSDFDIDDQVVMAWIKLQLAASDSFYGDSLALRRDFSDLVLEYRKHQEHLRSIVAGIAVDKGFS